MSDIKSIEIRCIHHDCRKWFPSGITFNKSENFDTANLYGNKISCIHCGRVTSCNKENMRVFAQKDGFRGIDT